MELISRFQDYNFKFSSIRGTGVTILDNDYSVNISDGAGSGCATCDAPRINKIDNKYYWSILLNSDTYSVGLVNSKHDLNDGNIGSADGTSLDSIALVRTKDAEGNLSCHVKGLGNMIPIERFPQRGEIVTIILETNTSPQIIFYVNGVQIASCPIKDMFFSSGSPLYVMPAVGNPNTSSDLISTSYNCNFGNNYSMVYSGVIIPSGSTPYNTEDGNVLLYDIYYVNSYNTGTQDGKSAGTGFSDVHKVIQLAKPYFFFGAKVIVVPFSGNYNFIADYRAFMESPIQQNNLLNYNWQFESVNKYMANIQIAPVGATVFPTISNKYVHFIFKRVWLKNVYSMDASYGCGLFKMEDCKFESNPNVINNIVIKRTNVHFINSLFRNVNNIELNSTKSNVLIENCSFLNMKGKLTKADKIYRIINCLFGKESYFDVPTTIGNRYLVLPVSENESTIENFNGYGPLYNIFTNIPMTGIFFDKKVVSRY